MSLFSSKVWGQKSSSIFRFEYFQVFNCPASLSLCVRARTCVCVCVCDRPANLCLLRKSSSEESRPQKQKYLQKSFYSPSKTKQGSKKQTRVLVWSHFFGGASLLSSLLFPVLSATMEFFTSWCYLENIGMSILYMKLQVVYHQALWEH